MSSKPKPTGPEIAEPIEPGASAQYLRGRPLRTYGLWLTLGMTGFTALFGAAIGILLPNQVQWIEFARFFTGADAGVDLQQLTQLRDAITAGTATAGTEQSRLLDLLTAFDSARASSLALITAIGVGGTMVVQPIIGMLSDRTRSRWGRRTPWMFAGSLIGASFLVALRFASTVALLALCWLVVQVTLNIALAPMNTTVADRVPENRRGIISALVGFASFFGGVFGAIAAGAGLAAIGLNTYFAFALCVALFTLVFLLVARDRSSLELAVEPLNWKTFFTDLVAGLKGRDFRWVLVARVILMFGYAMSTALGLYMLQSYVKPALSQAEATAIYPMIALVALPGTILAIVVAGAISDKLQRRKIFVVVASALMAIAMAIPLIWPAVPALFAQAIVAGIAFGVCMPVDMALVIDVLPDKRSAGRDLGVAALAQSLGQALGPILAGTVVATGLGYGGVWAAAIVLCALAAVAILPVRAR